MRCWLSRRKKEELQSQWRTEKAPLQPHPDPAASAAMKACVVRDLEMENHPLIPEGLYCLWVWKDQIPGFHHPPQQGLSRFPKERSGGRISPHILRCHRHFIFDLVINVSVSNRTVSSVRTRGCGCLFSPFYPPNFSFFYLFAMWCWSWHWPHLSSAFPEIKPEVACYED